MFDTKPAIMAAVRHRSINPRAKHCEVDFDKMLWPGDEHSVIYGC